MANNQQRPNNSLMRIIHVRQEKERERGDGKGGRAKRVTSAALAAARRASISPSPLLPNVRPAPLLMLAILGTGARGFDEGTGAEARVRPGSANASCEVSLEARPQRLPIL